MSEFERDGFFLFRNTFEAGKRLKKKKDRQQFYCAVLTYAFDGVIDEDLKNEARGMFELALPSLATSRARAQAGSKGGRNKPQANVKQTSSKTPSKTEAIKNKELRIENEEYTPPKSPKGDGAPAPSGSKPKQGGSKAAEPVKKPYGEFANVMLTDEEYSKLSPAARGLIEEMSCYIKSGGKGYKNHYAALLNWERRRRQEKSGGEVVEYHDPPGVKEGVPF